MDAKLLANNSLRSLLRSVAHPVVCCCALLGILAQSLKPIKLLSQQLPTFLLFRDRRSVAQQCWIRLPRMRITHGLLGNSEAITSRDRPTRVHDGPTMMGWSCCMRLQTTNTQQLLTLLAQQYCT